MLGRWAPSPHTCQNAPPRHLSELGSPPRTPRRGDTENRRPARSLPAPALPAGCRLPDYRGARQGPPPPAAGGAGRADGQGRRPMAGRPAAGVAWGRSLQLQGLVSQLREREAAKSGAAGRRGTLRRVPPWPARTGSELQAALWQGFPSQHRSFLFAVPQAAACPPSL